MYDVTHLMWYSIGGWFHCKQIWGLLMCFLLVEAMQSVLMLTHRRNVFICDFIIVVKDFQSQLYTYYCSTMACPSKVTNFSPSMGWCNVTTNKSTWNGSLIIIQILCNILLFFLNGESIWVHWDAICSKRIGLLHVT